MPSLVLPAEAPSVSSSAPAALHTPVVLQDLWLAILKKIEPTLPRGEFITWFRDTTIHSRDGDGTIVVGLPLPMSLNWHLERYQERTLVIAREIDPVIAKIVYTVDVRLKDDRHRRPDLLQHFPEQKKRKLPGRQEVKMAEGLIGKVLNPRYTLDHFVVGSNSRLAHAACQAVSMDPGGKYNPLFLYGGVGLGKTHLLQGTGNAILKQNPRALVLYTTSEDFTNEVVEAIRMQKMERIRQRYRRVDVLIIDDVQFLTNKERTQEEFFHTFNTLAEERKQIIISADRPPEELRLEDRLVSRFERGMIADISQPDYETRLAILTEKAKEYELLIDMTVLQFIAEHTTKNVRELEGILMQAVAQYELEQRMPTVRGIAEIMRKLSKDPHMEEEDVGFAAPPRKRATFQNVMEAIGTYYSVSQQDIIGNSRVREVLIPRQIAMYIGKTQLKISYVQLGALCGNRDHTTVMHAVQKIEREMHKDAQLLREVRAIEQEVGLG